MARKSKLNVFASTDGDLDAGNIQPVGVGLRQAEIAAIDEIAASLEVPRNQVLRFAIRRFILDYQAGKIDLSEYIEQPPPPKKSLRLPE